MNNRWWIYQEERFPLLAHGPLVIVFCLAIMLFSALQQGDPLPHLDRIAGAVLSTLIFFFQLRVADEHKDFTIDATFRPHRAVPRGLVSLRELARLAIAGAVVQFLIAVYVDIGLVPVLILVWAYMGLMTNEFFARSWLLGHPAVYLVSHMLVMPLIAFYVSSFDWLSECRQVPGGLGWILTLSFCSGLVLELGRKIKTPASERAGVETYSGLWGSRTAVMLWTASVVASVFAYVNAAAHLGRETLLLSTGSIALLLGLAVALAFPRTEGGWRSGAEKLIEPCSGLIALALYFGLGPLQAILD